MQDPLGRGRERFSAKAWCEAYEALNLADRDSSLDAADVERLATAAYLTGRELEFQRLHERRFRACADAGNCRGGARSAFWLALTLLLRGDIGQSNAWAARGRQLLAGRDCAERGYLMVSVVEQQLRSGHAAEALASAREAAAIGESCGESDLVAASRHIEGRALIALGRMADGLQRLDESMLPVVAGELTPIMTGLMYCSVIEACRRIYALDRGREWTAAFSRMCESQPELNSFTGSCHVHRAEIMQFHGAWPEAIAEARRACDRAQLAECDPPGAARYLEGEIHRLRGEFARAEAAYHAASLLGFEPQPGLALLRLAQDRTDAACAAIRRLADTARDRFERARFLPACVEILIAAGDMDEARVLAAELGELGAALESDVLRAIAAQAEGALLLAEGDPRGAIPSLRAAFDLWERLSAPYESARTRVLLGRACRALGDEESGRLELDAARSTFARLGARPDLGRLDALEAADTQEPGHPLTSRELDVLRLVAAGHSNKAIAKALDLSGRTVDRHVSNILGKLGVPSRTAATAYAYSRKLV
jgi:DNA-binding CsgD family transcriptional regulator